MTKNWAENLKNKSKYLLYFQREKKAGRLDTVQPYGMWLKGQQMGGSVQSKEQLGGLSSGDAAELQKHFGKKK